MISSAFVHVFSVSLYVTALTTFLRAFYMAEAGILYPHESETRTVRSLDGIWNFRLANKDDPLIGHREKWYEKELALTGSTIPMPVPSSYNDITEDKAIRDHVGIVWYDRTFFVPSEWNSNAKKVWLRFGSVHYAAEVYVNGGLVSNHSGGHVPFQVDVTPVLKFGQKNLISVAVNNILTDITVPQGQLGTLQTDNGTETVQRYTFDFFNYAGIHRSVYLFTTPSTYIDDITVTTDVRGDIGIISYQISIAGGSSPISVDVNLLDKEGKLLSNATEFQGNFVIQKANFWWPYLMHPEPAYLYILEVCPRTNFVLTVRHHLPSISEDKNNNNFLTADCYRIRCNLPMMVITKGPTDIYRVPVGIRKIAWNNDSLTINGKPIYIRGFGRHEDSSIRGKGHDFPLITRDYNLIKWIGANAYRTSHYPYSEEIMDFADRVGIMIIDECPGVNIGGFGFKPELLEAHKESLSRLYLRDKNRPSVIMWSVANEALTANSGADTYFSSIAEHMKSLDKSRPITMAIAVSPESDKAGQFMDVIGFNRYNSWYSNDGHTETIINNVKSEAARWRKKYNKPIFISEYGADAMPGLHLSPDYVWSEEYQVTVFSKHFQAFDELREEGYFIGEMIWNFADFNTAQTYTRVGGNKKGIFTRDRQPKASAHHTRKRYWALAQELDNATPPGDLNKYVSNRSTKQLKNEL